MKIPRILAISLLVLSSFAATGVAPTKTELENMYDKAYREFDANHYDEALKALDAIDARQPDLAEALNLRGVVLMRKGDYDKAEAALRKALDADPKFWNASFNLAEIPFLRKDWGEARNRFEALVAGNADEMKGETTLLIQYKILLTFVLQGKENMVDWIVNKFEGEKESPALYYSNAAIALHHNDQAGAKEWMDAAEKHYPPALNKLFAESFYEIGWLQKPAGETRAAIEITSTAERAERMRADAQANFEHAERAFQQHDFAGALKYLDLADEGAPNQAASYNLRGEILMEQKKFDEAEEQFHKAYNADPKFREAQYNLAQIPFKKKDYAKSRERLEALFGETPGGDTNQAAQLIKYKIFMTLLLEGNESQAQKLMDQFKFTGDTPALYYAQAAWAFKHNDPDQGNDWIKSARKIYSPALNIVFADSFYDLGWLKRTAETAPATTALAQAGAVAAGPTPAMRFGESESLPAPASSQPPVAASASPTQVTAATAPTSAPVTTKTTAVAPTAAPVVAKAAAPSTQPSVSISAAPTRIASTQPLQTTATSAPLLAPTAAPVIAKTTPAVLPKASAPAIAVSKPAASIPLKTATAVPLIARNSAAITPAATALAPARIREYSQPTFAEMMDRISEPRTLLIGLLLLSGVFILGWLVVQQVRRQIPGATLYGSSLPATGPRLAGEGAVASNERRLSREQLAAAPSKLSLKLKGSDGAAPVKPIFSGGSRKVKEVLPPNDQEESVSEVKAVEKSAVPVAKISAAPKAPAPNEPAKPSAPLRDEKEISLAATPAPVAMPPAPAKPLVPAMVAAQPPKPPVPVPPAAPIPSGPIRAVEEKITPPKPILPPARPIAESVVAREEPVGQGQPIPQLAPAPNEPIVAEVVEAKKSAAPASAPAVISEPKPALAAPQSSIETPAFTSKIVSTKPTTPSSTPIVIMPEPTPITAINEPRPAAPAPGAQPTPAATPAAAMQTAVQLTFSLEIVALQLTPSFKMGSLQLKPISKIVSMRLAPSAQPQPAMNLQVTFELAAMQIGAGASIGTVRLTPSSAQRPAASTSPSFEISGLQLVSGSAATPVQLNPAHQTQASVLMTASFQIATVEFSPSFEIASVVLNSSSKNVAVQLPGTGPSSIEGAPVFEVANVQLSGNDLSLVTLNPLGTGRRA